MYYSSLKSKEELLHKKLQSTFGFGQKCGSLKNVYSDVQKFFCASKKVYCVAHIQDNIPTTTNKMSGFHLDEPHQISEKDFEKLLKNDFDFIPIKQIRDGKELTFLLKAHFSKSRHTLTKSPRLVSLPVGHDTLMKNLALKEKLPALAEILEDENVDFLYQEQTPLIDIPEDWLNEIRMDPEMNIGVYDPMHATNDLSDIPDEIDMDILREFFPDLQ